MRSNSAVERTNPPPRRKSCAACIKAKRRCDNAQPACLRCERRAIACRYPAGSSATARQTVQTAGDVSSWTPVEPATAVAAVADIAPAVATGDELDVWAQDLATVYATPCTPFPSITELMPTSNADDIFDYLPSTPFGTTILSPLTTTTHPPPSILAADPKDLQLFSSPSPKPPATTNHASNLIDSRLSYSLSVFKLVPAQMATQLQTPWSHHALYRDCPIPPCMQDALGTCALYGLAKTPANTRAIFDTIDRRVADLHAEVMASSSSSSSSNSGNSHASSSSSSPSTQVSPETLLARAQALLLYQIIRLFDGDIPARAAAERASPTLERAALALLSYMTFDDGVRGAALPPPARNPRVLPLWPGATAAAAAIRFWRAWALMESSRRTFAATFLVLGMYRVMAGRQAASTCDERLLLCGSMTLSGRLWGAGDAVGFAGVWNEGCGGGGGGEGGVEWEGGDAGGAGDGDQGERDRHLVTTVMTVGRIFERGKAEDFDVFGKMLMTGMMGVEEARGFLASKGGVL